MIATVRGPVPVEASVPAIACAPCWVATRAEVIWVGRRKVDCARHPDPRKVWPVRVSAHAFGRGMPAADLLLSPDHAVYVDHVLIPIRLLLNGKTVRQEVTDRVSYHHIELARARRVAGEWHAGGVLPGHRRPGALQRQRRSYRAASRFLRPGLGNARMRAVGADRRGAGGVRKRLAADVARRRRIGVPLAPGSLRPR